LAKQQETAAEKQSFAGGSKSLFPFGAPSQSDFQNSNILNQKPKFSTAFRFSSTPFGQVSISDSLAQSMAAKANAFKLSAPQVNLFAEPPAHALL
jgi:hypothetical protein